MAHRDDQLDPGAAPTRVLHLNSLLTGGGTDDQCARLALGLQQLGLAVAVAGPDGRPFSDVIRGSGVRFHPTPSEGPAKVRFMLAAARLIRRERIQVVHGHHGRDLWPTILAARWSGVRPRVVLTRHMAKSPSSWVSRRFLLAQCDAIIAVSRFVERVLREGVDEPGSPEPERRHRPPLRGSPTKIHVIYGGIDTGQFQPRPAEDARVQALRREWNLGPEHFAFAVAGGYDHPRGKGQREFLAAAARIHAEVPHARFLIVGRGTLEDQLRADIARLQLAGAAWLTPFCPDMPTGMNALDCLVHPQIGTEALGLVVCEALACGKPVIASALDGIPEAFAVGGCGQLVQPESVGELATALRRWAQRPRLTPAERGALHAKVSAVFSLQTAAQNVAHLYRKLLARP